MIHITDDTFPKVASMTGLVLLFVITILLVFILYVPSLGHILKLYRSVDKLCKNFIEGWDK